MSPLLCHLFPLDASAGEAVLSKTTAGRVHTAIVRGLAVISLQNCFPWCTRDITNG